MVAFIDWAPIVRAAVFAPIFVVALAAACWVWYDSSFRPGPDRWLWRIMLTLFAALTAPAVVLSFVNFDSDHELVLNICAWLSIGAGALALLAVAAFAAWGRGAVPMPVMPAMPMASPEPWPVPPPDPPTPIPAPRQTGPVDAYFFVKAGPEKGKQFPLHDAAMIGRNADQCTIALDDRRVSRVHAQVKRSGGQFIFTDLESGNGSFLRVEGREEQIRTPQMLVDGDEVRVGQTVFEFVDTRSGRRR